jgi:signal transduction histidine kinase
VITTLLILLLIAGVVITVFIANKRHVQQEVKIAQMQLDYTTELRLAEQEAQEHVLVNVARELHDNIGQLLTIMRMQVQQQMITNPETAPSLQSLDSTLDHTSEEVRRLGRSLNSDLLDGYGLINIMQQEVIRLQQLNKYTIHWDYDEEPVLEKDQKVITFRIFQEILNNILKHAGGKNIYITLQGLSHFKMMVRDDGKGFDVDAKLRAGSGSGLKNMLKRAELAKLKCNINSVVDKGTTFTLEQTTY